uniref:Kelch-like family member 38b n=1 Tax=Sinocyclocheilus anshuiensis TaxID=1608454 RepID=A0A671PWL7_9TELE
MYTKKNIFCNCGNKYPNYRKLNFFYSLDEPISEGKEIPCHRNVLVSSSPYFYAMFCSSFLETQKPQINLQGVPYDILTSMVEYVYTGSISITMELVLPLMQTASMLQYGRLFEACSTFLQAQLSPDNCLSMIRLAEILHCSSLREKARELAVKSFSDVVVSEDFCELLLPELVSYLEDDRLCVEEEQVFKTLLAWIHHNPFSRQRRCHAETSSNDPGLIFQGYFGCLIMYHIGRNLWCRMETRTVKNVCAPAAVIDDKIYIVGGYTRRMVAYDVKTNRFEKCENMKARKMHHSATVVNDKIYVTGGRFINSHESVEDSDSFDCYDPTTDSWASMGTLPFKLFDHGSVPLVYLSDKFLPT